MTKEKQSISLLMFCLVAVLTWSCRKNGTEPSSGDGQDPQVESQDQPDDSSSVITVDTETGNSEKPDDTGSNKPEGALKLTMANCVDPDLSKILVGTNLTLCNGTSASGTYAPVVHCNSQGQQNCLATGDFKAFDVDDDVLASPLDLGIAGDMSTTQSPTTSWTSPYSANVTFEYAVGTTDGGTEVVAWKNVGTALSHQETGLSLLTTETYYTSIRTVDDHGRKSPTITSGMWTLSAVSCKAVKDNNPSATSGEYTLDPDGVGPGSPVTAYCDMDADGGGWTLILNYNHEGGTNPALNARTTSMPLIGSDTIGTDESGTDHWGHLAPSLLNTLSFTDVRFMCENDVGGVVDFKTSSTACINYFKSGTGTCNDLPANNTTLTGHTGVIPAGANGAFSNKGNNALTDFPFYKSSAAHWGIAGQGSRWECDDFAGNSSKDTLHRAWVR